MVKVIIFLFLLLAITRPSVLSPQRMDNAALPECVGDDDCPNHKACVSLSCVDPCDGRCGNNTECHARDHIAACSCLPGYSGHPFASTGCIANTNQGFTSGTIGHRNSHGGRKQFHAKTFSKKNWFESFLYCQSNGKQLATIQSKEENEQFFEEIKKSEGYKNDNKYLFWTAGTDLAKEGEWYWMTTGLPIDGFSDWSPNEPENFEYREHCLGFADRNPKKWFDADCKKILAYFVCESYE
ncbi:aggrecan core protein-like isoform X1 [Homalodisca vitripennis]|uniref:aggrecan core protein-like isoform X1 n=1 Tax=Homalodisca vitripennis TaxID=197043 RepID=UPI001EEC2E5E|nr:aggrecan core protein-like isoform X1 [Homalodisca vitripennis]XP_046671760.1 aggrecan core protein-like isoform X1 [Homalodisca vitripennis]XP_046671761.1 aggrecan core protein-like isoform X1 [Homalodisca vitripennis]XP_046671762.1 aggrecan core protein-like isoform X1 [Homalodisca vitripennis]XP_046671763.1 aggrecan core protein-like isoform X1 [Homalodisca vitripennis]XP_046671764.1 aggrecan core protein-like isoform X1 [Homalodisca vitripennis]